MSTKAIREALESVRWDGLSGKERPSYVAALAEVEAIEKAAKALYRCSPGIPMGMEVAEVINAQRVVDSIATQST